MKIALFGGSFDPIHMGHLKIIKALINELNVDKVLVIPTNVNYYKKNNLMFTYNQRLDFCRLMTNDIDNVEVSEIERNIKDDEGFSDTVIKLKEMYPLDELLTVIGSDSYNYINTWRRYNLILDNSKLVVVTRPNQNIDSNMGIEHIKLELNEDISSTMIRESIKSLILDKKD